MLNYFIQTVVFAFGAVFGSFFNVCIYRMPRNKSIIRPPSACPHCEKPIKFYDNIPIVSYIILGGKCRNCGARISIRYPLVELITAVLFLMLYRKYSLSYQLGFQMFFVSLLIIISFIDYDFQIIPDVLSIGGLIAGMIISFARPDFRFIDSLYGVLLGGGVLFVIAYGYKLIAKREGMGGGDIKLLAMLGSFLGYKGVIFSLVGGSIIGTIVGIPLMIMKGEGTKYAIPFGPFLALSAVLYLFVGHNIVFKFTQFIFHA